MKAQVLFGINDLRYETQYKEPVLQKEEALIKIANCGICGSDIDRVFKNGTYHFPTIIGHEFSGTVEDTFDSKNMNWIGKRVSVFPLIPCKNCISCSSGDYQLCENYNYLGSRCDGGFAEYVTVPIWNLLEIPKEVSLEEAAMLEPASVAIHAFKMSNFKIGDSVVIYGTGTIATILLQIALASSASKVICAGRNQEKLNYIHEMFPNIFILNTTESDFTGKLCTITNGGPNISIEGTGSEEIVSKAVLTTRRKGIVVLMGNPSRDVNILHKIYWQILRKELVLKGTWNSSYGISSKSDWENVFSLLVNHQLNLKSLISHRFELKDLQKGLLLMKNKIELYNKVMIKNEM